MIALLLVSMLAAAPNSGGALRRFALITGANDGGRDRVQLRYATSDAQTIAQLLTSMGGVAMEDRELLLEPSAVDFRAALGRVASQVARVGSSARPVRTEVVLYYSGHSDEQGLLLRGERVGYSELRAWLSASKADVRIAILDSCASGALTREKGGARIPPFLIDASSAVRGHAFLTSSSADEASQESDRIQASYFTHYLASALRGAADVTRDGRITLNEAYHFAFQETLAQTERSKSGPQHPAYDIQLVGTGDSVMTQLNPVTATLVLGEPERGRFFVRDTSGRLVAELRKFAGRQVELGLEPGRYRVTRELEGAVGELTLALEQGQRTQLPATFSPVSLEATVARGDLPVVSEAAAPFTPVTIAVTPGLATSENATAFSFGILGARSQSVRGVGLSSVWQWTREDFAGVQLAGVGGMISGNLSGVQLGSVVNTVGGTATGVQVSSFNYANALSSGAQLGAAVNVVRGEASGLQMSGGVNLMSRASRGAQLSAGVNLAQSMIGLQMGTINVVGQSRGAQVGVLNIAQEHKGFQLGVVNIARELDGEALGIVNVIGNGRMHVDLLGSETSFGQLALRMGSRRLQTVFLIGALGRDVWATGMGLAWHFRGDEPLFVDLDLLGQSAMNGFTGDSSNVWVTLRPTIGYRLLPWLALVGGPSFNAYLPLGDGQPTLGVGPKLPFRLGGKDAVGWIGFAAGLRLL